MSGEKWIEVHSDFSLAKQCQLQALRHQRSVVCWQQRRWSMLLGDIEHHGDGFVDCNAAIIFEEGNVPTD